MSGYTKLFSSIVHSTIWRESNQTRIVWITMLAIADKNGEVEASVPGLADLSRVEPDRCRDALHTLSLPDPDSRSQEYEGRRIEAIDGGWILLNHAKYREKMSSDDRREKNRIRMQRYRKSKIVSRALSHSVANSDAVTPHAEADTEADTDTDAYSESNTATKTEEAKTLLVVPPKKRKKKSRKIEYTSDFEKAWIFYPKRKRLNKQYAFECWEAQEENRPPIDKVVEVIQDMSTTYDWLKDNGKWIPLFSTFINKGGWNNEVDESSFKGEETKGQKRDRELQEFLAPGPEYAADSNETVIVSEKGDIPF